MRPSMPAWQRGMLVMIIAATANPIQWRIRLRFRLGAVPARSGADHDPAADGRAHPRGTDPRRRRRTASRATRLDAGPRDRPIRQKITPTLMFVGNVCGKTEEAIDFYTSVLHDARVGDILRYAKG